MPYVTTGHLPITAPLSSAERAGIKRDTSWISPRVLLLFGCLLIMMVSNNSSGYAAPRVGALIAAAVAAGIALFRPIVVGDLGRERRAALALVVTPLVAGLLLTGWILAPMIADKASPLWFAVILGYAILGVAGALQWSRRLLHGRWALPLFLTAHAALTVALLRTSPAGIDVQVYLQEGVIGLFHGHNPYSMTIPNIYPAPLTEMFYGHDIVVDGRVDYGFPYLPVALLVAIPGHLLGDVRYSQLIAMLVTVLVLRRLASDRTSRAASVLAVAAPTALPMLTGAWVEPSLVALLACLVLALERQRTTSVALLLGLFLASKQYVVVAIPILWILQRSVSRRVILLGLGVSAAVIVPFFLVDPAAFWRAIVEFQLKGPFRPDSLSLLVSSVKEFGWPPPWTYGVLPLMGGGLTAIALALRAPRTPAAFAAGVGLTLLVTILLSKQAFMNYYFLVSGAFLIAAVAWPALPGSTPSEPAPLDAQP